jgi:hypothetical protein
MQIAFQKLAIRKAKVPSGLVKQSADRFKQLLDEIRSPSPDLGKIAQLLGGVAF